MAALLTVTVVTGARRKKAIIAIRVPMLADPLNPERSSYVNSESPIRTCLNRKPTRFLRKSPGRPAWKIVIDPRRRGSLRVRHNIHDNLLGPLIFSAGSGLSSFTIRYLKEAMDEADYRCVGLSLGGKDGKLRSDVTTNLGDGDMRIEWISGRVIGRVRSLLLLFGGAYTRSVR